MSEKDAMIPVIEHHLRQAVRLMQATGEGPNPQVWDELEPFLPRIQGSDRFEKTPWGFFDWKSEALHLNRELVKAQLAASS